jgi:hypothetical protein
LTKLERWGDRAAKNARAIALVASISAVLIGAQRHPVAGDGRTKNVVLVVIDGLRWQEVFTGADSTLLARESAAVRAAFWRPSPGERRAALMPFLWSTIARDGALFGDRVSGSDVRVTNQRNVSYPGYNELLTGKVDPRIRDNDFGANRNATVLHWLAAKPAFRGRVAAYGTWEKFDEIFDRRRGSFVVRAGWTPPYQPARTPEESAIDRAYRSPRHQFDDVAPDALMQRVVLNDLRALAPRVMFVGYGEADEWAHKGEYDRVLHAAHAADSLIAELWATLQSRPNYRGTTTLIITADHGRGASPSSWRNHDQRTRGSDETWLAVIGPDTPALGVHPLTARITATQVAATVAALLGENYASAVPGVGAPIGEIIGR